MSGEFTSIDDARERLAGVGYLADEPASLVSFLAARLGKPYFRRWAGQSIDGLRNALAQRDTE